MGIVQPAPLGHRSVLVVGEGVGLALVLALALALRLGTLLVAAPPPAPSELATRCCSLAQNRPWIRLSAYRSPHMRRRTHALSPVERGAVHRSISLNILVDGTSRLVLLRSDAFKPEVLVTVPQTLRPAIQNDVRAANKLRSALNGRLRKLQESPRTSRSKAHSPREDRT